MLSPHPHLRTHPVPTLVKWAESSEKSASQMWTGSVMPLRLPCKAHILKNDVKMKWLLIKESHEEGREKIKYSRGWPGIYP